MDFNTKRTWGPTPAYDSVLRAGDQGFKLPLFVAGPCSIGDKDQVVKIADTLKKCGVQWMRGGVNRSGTYGAQAEGFREDLLKMWAREAHARCLKIAVEVVDLSVLKAITRYADAFQVGARQMQNYGLLRALRELGKPVFLKRNMGATLDEFLGASEYLAIRGCPVVLVERGGSSHLNHVRWDVSVSLISAIKRLTRIPILVDASHGTGRRDLVESVTLAGIAAGADGFMLEVHPDPENSISDADQALPLEALKGLIKKSNALRKTIVY